MSLNDCSILLVTLDNLSLSCHTGRSAAIVLVVSDLLVVLETSLDSFPF